MFPTMTTWHHIPEQDTSAKYWKASRRYKKGGKKLKRKGYGKEDIHLSTHMKHK
jgi:hypothetical protein